MPLPLVQSRRELEREAKLAAKAGEEPPEGPAWRPRTRADCATFPRPCPFVGCRYHLFLDVGSNGQIKYNFGDDVESLYKMKDTCALDVAMKGGIQLEAIGKRCNFTRERARQQEVVAMDKLRAAEDCIRPGNVDLYDQDYS